MRKKSKSRRSKSRQRNKITSKEMKWHYILGLGLTDYFYQVCYRVETEIDLSIKQQRLDIVVLREEEGEKIDWLCDGFENLKQYNLITFKSFQESLGEWTLDELISHYVNYRKQESPSEKELIPKSAFQLYGISARCPRKLFQAYDHTEVKPGVFDLSWGAHQIRVIVLCQLPMEEKNALWLLFTGDEEKIQYGLKHYRWKQEYLELLMTQLYQKYQEGGILMSYTVDDFLRDYGSEMERKFRAIELQLEKEKREKKQILLKEREEKEQILLKEKEARTELENLKKLLKEKGIVVN